MEAGTSIDVPAFSLPGTRARPRAAGTVETVTRRIDALGVLRGVAVSGAPGTCIRCGPGSRRRGPASVCRAAWAVVRRSRLAGASLRLRRFGRDRSSRPGGGRARRRGGAEV